MAFNSQGLKKFKDRAMVSSGMARGLYEPKSPTPGKGKQGLNCNVTACQRPDSANHYNKVMHAWYCRGCAEDIERWAKVDGMSLFDNLDKRMGDNEPS